MPEEQEPIAGAPMSALDGATASYMLRTLVRRPLTSSGSLLTLADRLDEAAAQSPEAERPQIQRVAGIARDMASLWPDGMGGIAPLAAPLEMAPGAIEEIAAERARQIQVEGWTPEHDDVQPDKQLSLAAACYLRHRGEGPGARYAGSPGGAPWEWPWEPEWWKPTTWRRDLVKAGALIVAEIERIDRRNDRLAEAGP